MFAAATLANYNLLLPKTSYSGWIEFVCPFHNDHKPSCYMNEERFHCVSCEASGTIPQFIAAIENQKRIEWNQTHQNKKRLYDDFDGTMLMFKFQKNAPDVLRNYVSIARKRNSEQEKMNSYAFFKSLNSPNWEHLSTDHFRMRGYSIDTLKHFQVKINNRSHHPYVIPIFQNSEFEGLVYRRASEEITPKYLFSPGCDRNLIIGTAQNLIHDDVLVVEGPSDMLMAYQYGWTNVLCLFGWYCSNEQAKQILKKATGVVSGLNNDTAGRKGLKRLKQIFLSQLPLYQLSLPEEINDIGESTKQQFLKAMWSIKEIK